MDAADAGVHHVSHELPAPLLGGVSPGTHPVQVAQLVARVDHRAVDFSCPFRRQPAGEYRKHCLVQLGKAGCGVAAAQVCQAGEHQTQGCECGDAQAPAHVLQLGCGLPRRAQVRETQREAGIEVEQIAVLRTFRKALQQTPGAAHPTGSDHHISADEPQQPQVQGLHGRIRCVAVVLEAVVDVLGNLQRFLDLPEPPRGSAQETQVPGLQFRQCSGLAELLVGGMPVAAGVRRPRCGQQPVKLVHPRHHFNGSAADSGRSSNVGRLQPSGRRPQ